MPIFSAFELDGPERTPESRAEDGTHQSLFAAAYMHKKTLMERKYRLARYRGCRSCSFLTQSYWKVVARRRVLRSARVVRLLACIGWLCLPRHRSETMENRGAGQVAVC